MILSTMCIIGEHTSLLFWILSCQSGKMKTGGVQVQYIMYEAMIDPIIFVVLFILDLGPRFRTQNSLDLLEHLDTSKLALHYIESEISSFTCKIHIPIIYMACSCQNSYPYYMHGVFLLYSFLSCTIGPNYVIL